jgi:hypothetical protein
MEAQGKTKNERLTINLPPEVRSLVDSHRQQLAKETGVRLSLAQAAASLVRRGAEAQATKH